jgi:hypothetical protein
MTERQRPYPPDEPIIGATYPAYDEPEPSPNGFDDDDEGGYIGAPIGEPQEDWDDEYQDPYDDYYYDDEYYDTEPARQPLFYVIIGLAVVLGGLLVFLVFQLLGGGDSSPSPSDPDFNITIDTPLENDRINIDRDVEVRIRANSTERITLIQLRVNGQLTDEQQFAEEPAGGVYSATLMFRVNEPDEYVLVARAVSETGVISDSEPVTVIAVESIDDRPTEIIGQVITNVNARTGPGDEYPAVRTIGSGEVLTIVGRTPDSQWLLIDDDTWVRRAAVELSESVDLVDVRRPTPTPAPTPTETPEPEPSPSPSPAADAPDFTPTNATLDGGGSVLRVNISNLTSNGYEGPLVVRVTGLGDRTLEQVFAVDLPGNGATSVQFAISPPHTEGATVQVIVDPDGAVIEVSDDNNMATFVLAPPVEAPDLIIAGAHISGSTVSVTIINIGGELPSTDVTVRLSIGGTSTESTQTIALGPDQTANFIVPAPGSGEATITLLVNGQQVDTSSIQIPGNGGAETPEAEEE